MLKWSCDCPYKLLQGSYKVIDLFMRRSVWGSGYSWVRYKPVPSPVSFPQLLPRCPPYHQNNSGLENKARVRFPQHSNGLLVPLLPQGTVSGLYSVTHRLTWPSPLQTLGNLTVSSFPRLSCLEHKTLFAFIPFSKWGSPTSHQDQH